MADGSYQPNAADQARGFVNGFPLTVHIINGGIECMNPNPPRDGNGTPFDQVRVKYYQYFAKALGANVTNNDTGTCTSMNSLFGLDSSSSRPYYIEPGSGRFVAYETPFIAYGVIDTYKKAKP